MPKRTSKATKKAAVKPAKAPAHRKPAGAATETKKVGSTPVLTDVPVDQRPASSGGVERVDVKMTPGNDISSHSTNHIFAVTKDVKEPQPLMRYSHSSLEWVHIVSGKKFQQSDITAWAPRESGTVKPDQIKE